VTEYPIQTIITLLNNPSGDERNTLLHTAAKRNRSVPHVCSLIKFGLLCKQKNAAGQTAADIARNNNQTILVQLLERAEQQQADEVSKSAT
jgi:ankyrin repeat protein